MREPSDDVEPSAGSLWRDFRDGTGGPGMRVVLSLAAGPLVGGMALGAACLVSTIWDHPRNWSNIHVDEEIIASAVAFAGVLYLMILVGIWSRFGRSKSFWLGGAKTVGIGLVAVVLSMGIDRGFSGDEEALILTVWLIAAGVTLLVWAGSWRSHTRGQPLYAVDGRINLRCPECGYRMVGLSEARCPECGQRYTLDDLLAKQDFAAVASRT